MKKIGDFYRSGTDFYQSIKCTNVKIRITAND
jgi:hypothetical protein